MSKNVIVEKPQGETGNKKKRSSSKMYNCASCDAPMRKRGEGLGKWVCSKNSSHKKACVV